MTNILKTLREQWCHIPEYTDVEALFWSPEQPRDIKYPHGCNLEIYEEPENRWGTVPGHVARRQTRLCRTHGYARIYVITGPDALALPSHF